ncbi:hypothetical protein TNCV_1150201 [Trichonephila clavipes]|nr:hypothetical protein TNCV_1150201 [Trichonephila clavipes]
MCVHHNGSKNRCDHLCALNKTWIHLKKSCLDIRVPRFVIDHTIEDAPVCDAASCLTAAMVSKLRVHAVANVVKLFMQTLANDSNSRLRACDMAAQFIKVMRP